MADAADTSTRLRILSLCQGATDTICALGLEDCLVGPWGRFQNFRSIDQNDPRGHEINWELVSKLEPDVVFIGSETEKGTWLQIEASQKQISTEVHNCKCRVVSLQFNTLEDLLQNLETIAKCCHVATKGVKLSNTIQTKLKEIKQRTPQWADGVPRLNVACLSSLTPLTAAGYWVPEVISYAGGISPYTVVGSPKYSVTLADLMKGDPDVVVYLCHGLHMGNTFGDVYSVINTDEWRKLKAVKTNRFFLVDADRFFIDSASNVVLSAEIMMEICHGFQYGHEENAFIRWQKYLATQSKICDDETQVNIAVLKNETLTGTSLNAKCINSDHHNFPTENLTMQPPAVDDSKCVTNVYDIKSSGIDGCFEPEMLVGVVDIRKKHTIDDVMHETKLDTQLDSETKVIQHISSVSTVEIDKLERRDAVSISSSHGTWPKPVIERHHYNHLSSQKISRAMQDKTISRFDGSSTLSGSSVRSFSKELLCAGRKSPCDYNSEVIGKNKYEQELIRKMWTITQSAAQPKSCRGVTDKFSNSFTTVRPSNAPLDYTFALGGSTSLSAISHNRQDQGDHSLSSTTNFHSKQFPRRAKVLREMVLKTLADLQSLECLLLSGGLASTILVEAVPLVHSKDFSKGFTVLAGPEATDRVSAALIAKSKGIDHVIIGDKDKESAVYLLAKELEFVIGTLRTFDPVQIRHIVPVAAALREAKNRGLKYVVTGDGLDELISSFFQFKNDSFPVKNNLQSVLSQSAVRLGEALGIKVIQPFLNPHFLEACKSLTSITSVSNKSSTDARLILRQAFPEVSITCREKNPIEIGSGMISVSQYFSAAIPISVFEKKAKQIYYKERIRIQNAEQLVYYRVFKRVLKGNIPKSVTYWHSEICPSCGNLLPSDISWYCLICGYTFNILNAIPDLCTSDQRSVDVNWKVMKWKSSIQQECSSAQSEPSVDSVNSKLDSFKKKQSKSSGKLQYQNVPEELSKPSLSTKTVSSCQRKPHKDNRSPNYLPLVGVASACLLLLFQFSRR